MRRGLVTMMVLWVLVVGGIVIAETQRYAFRQALAGREAVARVRAYWAARAGVEVSIAELADHTLDPNTGDAYALVEALENVAIGEVSGASWSIGYETEQGVYAGAVDAQSKLNINLLGADQLLLLTYMTEDVADSILDWVDEDDDLNPYGAEFSYYSTAPYPYEPRNAPMPSLMELELVAGVQQSYVRGEDWNLNRRLDPNEDDGNLSWPPDNGDGILDAGWSATVTAASPTGTGLAMSGEARLDLSLSDASTIASRTGVSSDQAEVILAHATSGGDMSDFIRQSLAQLDTSGGGGGGGRFGGGGSTVSSLSRDQLRVLIDECMIGTAPPSGGLNINTCDAEVLDYLPEIGPSLSDAVIFERDSRVEGFTSFVDLLDVPAMSNARLADLYGVIDVRSDLYEVHVRGRDERSGIEVELDVLLDRSTLPVTVQEIIVR